MAEIVGIRRQDRCRCLGSSDDHMRIHDIGSADLGQECSDLMRLLWSEAEDVATAQKAPKLHLPKPKSSWIRRSSALGSADE